MPSSGTDFQIVETTLSDKMAAMSPLFEAHRDELEPGWAGAALAPCVEAYRTLEERGSLFTLMACLGDEIVGYSVNIVGPHLHYPALRYADNDVLFVKREHRGGTLGIALMRRTEQAAKEKGAARMLWHAKPGTVLEKLLPRIGYAVQEIVFSKEV